MPNLMKMSTTWDIGDDIGTGGNAVDGGGGGTGIESTLVWDNCEGKGGGGGGTGILGPETVGVPGNF